MNKMKSKKHPSCFNMGLPVFTPQQRPTVPWVPASVVESLLSGSMPVFSKKDEQGLYLTWSRTDVETAEILGFVLGPYKLPPMEILLGAKEQALNQEVKPREAAEVHEAAETAMVGTVHEVSGLDADEEPKEKPALIIAPSGIIQ